jgi:hypothetical protein
MMELVDMQDLKSCGHKAVRVRFPLSVQIKTFYKNQLNMNKKAKKTPPVIEDDIMGQLKRKDG